MQRQEDQDGLARISSESDLSTPAFVLPFRNRPGRSERTVPTPSTRESDDGIGTLPPTSIPRRRSSATESEGVGPDPYSAPLGFYEDQGYGPWDSRRPSSSSLSQTSTTSSRYRRGSSSSTSQSTSQYRAPSRTRQNSSSQSTHTAPSPSQSGPPTPRSASRSKILTSSAQAIGGILAPSLPFEYRMRSSSGDYRTSDGPDSPGARTTNLRLPTSSSPSSRNTVLPGSASIAERKRRLASASGNTNLHQSQPSRGVENSLLSNTNISSDPALFIDSLDPSSPSLSRMTTGALSNSNLANTSPSSLTERTFERDRVEARDTVSLRPSFRSRLFGLRKPSKQGVDEPDEEGEGPSISPSTSFKAISPPAASPPPSSSSQAARLAQRVATGGLSPSLLMSEAHGKAEKLKWLEEQQNVISEPSQGDKFLQQLSAKGSEIPENGSSWITSLSSASPATAPRPLPLDIYHVGGADASKSDLSSPGGEDPRKHLQRTSSWPASERKGSFVSIKGQGSGTGYRFENVAYRAGDVLASRSNISLPRSGSASGNFNVPPPTPPEAKLGSPALLQSEYLADSQRPKSLKGPSAEPRELSSSSLRNTPPRIGAGRPSTGDSGGRKGQRATATGPSLHAADLQLEANIAIAARKEKRRSASNASSVVSIYSNSNSPTTLLPRSSSLLNTPAASSKGRPSSTHNSYVTAPSPSIEASDQLDQMGAERKGSVRSPTWKRSNNSMPPTSATEDALTKPGEEVDGRADVRSEMSPQSLFSARQELSPPLWKLAQDDAPPMIVSPPDRLPAPLSSLKVVEEPRRPKKSPLRIASTSMQGSGEVGMASNNADTARRTVSSPLAVGKDKQPGTSDGKQSRWSAGRSPPRRSIEDAVQLESISFAIGAADERTSSPSVPAALQSAPDEHKSVYLQPVPENAKKSIMLARSLSGNGGETAQTSATASVTSLVTEGEEPHSANSTSFGKRYKSLRKVTPPSLANAFSRSISKGTASAIEETMLEQGDEASESGLQADNSMLPALGVKRKAKRWPFGKDAEGEGKAAVLPSDALAKNTKTGRGIRGRKSQPPAVRPVIRRVFNGSDEDSEDESEAILASVSPTPNTQQTPSQQPRSPSKDSTVRVTSASLSDVPLTPLIASEEMHVEVKRVIRRRNVIRELVKTESNYASDLTVVRDIYLARARLAVGLLSSTPLQTPLSAHATPTGSPAGTPPVGAGTLGGGTRTSNKASPLYATHQKLRQALSSELPVLPSTAGVSTHVTASPSSLASSSDPSNRSSTYTVSSQTSHASDASFPFQGSNVPPLPTSASSVSTPPSVASASTLHSYSPTFSASTSTFSTPRNSNGRPKVTAISTNSHHLGSRGGASSSSPRLDTGLTQSDVRVIFAHLEACCAFAEESASTLASSMGTFARMKKVKASDVTAAMDAEDDKVGETFLNLMSRIRSINIDYCSRHESAIIRLQDVITSSPKAESFFRECDEIARKQTNAWDLASLLIKPVQRVLKYPLLLQELVSTTKVTHPDYSHLLQALEEIQTVADDINRVKRRRDLADLIITGRHGDSRNVAVAPNSGGGAASSSASTLRGKKKSEARLRDEDSLFLHTEAEDAAIVEYATLEGRFRALANSVSKFGLGCVQWSASLHDSYEGQLKVMTALRRVYRLRMPEKGGDGSKRDRGSLENGEDAVLTAYIRLMRHLISESCDQVDKEIKLTVVPMASQIARMFESPRLVMDKREERLADYHRYRQLLQAGRQADRKVVESATGFAALNAQLVEELPMFLFGVKTLLDVGVQAFARLQSAHFDLIRSQTLHFWRDVAGQGKEIIMPADGSGIPTLRHINSVRSFWEKHSTSAACLDALMNTQREGAPWPTIREDGEESGYPSAASTPGWEEGQSQAMTSNLQVLKSLGERRPSVTSISSSGDVALSGTDHSNNGYLHPMSGGGNAAASNPLRRPSGVAGLMRTISGTFNREHSANSSNGASSNVPPMPDDALIRHSPGTAAAVAITNVMPPSLPSLVFRDGAEEDGYFVQPAQHSDSLLGPEKSEPKEAI